MITRGTPKSRTRSSSKVEDEVLLKLENNVNAKGRVEIVAGMAIELIQINTADPWTEVDGERSSAKTKHPLFSDPAVRRALGLLVDRGSIEAQIYGRTGVATGNFINSPERFVSKNTKWEFSVDKTNQLLDEAGWKRGPDGIRAKDGKKLKLVFQTSINAPRQKTQAIIKQACQKAGIDVGLKSITPSVYFSSDAANPGGFRPFVDTGADAKVAPIPDLLGLARERLEPTCARHSESGSDQPNRIFSLMANEPAKCARQRRAKT
jgi:peptide/nickel transport system substrate-binding protein